MTFIFRNKAGQWLRQAIGLCDRDFDVVQMKGSTSSSVFLTRCLKDSASKGEPDSSNLGDP
jgi:hypothetical protein